MANDQNAGYGTGRRKTAVARVRLQPGEGRITINEMPALKYLGRRTLELVVMTPFRVVDTKRFDASVRVGGTVRGTGQGRSKKQAEQAAARVAWAGIVAEVGTATAGAEPATEPAVEPDEVGTPATAPSNTQAPTAVRA